MPVEAMHREAAPQQARQAPHVQALPVQDPMPSWPHVDDNEGDAPSTVLRPRQPGPDDLSTAPPHRRAEPRPPEAAAQLEISIGRISIEFARPAEAPPQPSRPAASPSRGFAGYQAARRGRLR